MCVRVCVSKCQETKELLWRLSLFIGAFNGLCKNLTHITNWTHVELDHWSTVWLKRGLTLDHRSCLLNCLLLVLFRTLEPYFNKQQILPELRHIHHPDLRSSSHTHTPFYMNPIKTTQKKQLLNKRLFLIMFFFSPLGFSWHQFILETL